MGTNGGSKYKIRNVQGAVGDNAHADQSTFTQYSGGEHQIDLTALEPELARLKEAMLREASNDNQRVAAEQVQVAKEEAKKGNEPGMLTALKTAGEWALKVATDIGSKLAIEAIKKAIGLP